MIDVYRNNFYREILQKRYEILQVLGNKPRRKTLLAYDIKIKKLVVIKLLIFNDEFIDKDLRLFESEVKIIKELKHPGIPHYIDHFEFSGDDKKGYALVQSYIPGRSLAEYLQWKRKFTEKEVKIIAKSLLEILIYLHKQLPPIIHRDIKPSNIILADRPYLIDFGCAQTLQTRYDDMVPIVGTCGYMSPEQLNGAATTASDLYSLGATLITLSTGIQPTKLPRQKMRIEFEDFVKFSSGLVNWLQWMTETNLKRRSPSAEVALEALKTGKIANNKLFMVSFYNQKNSYNQKSSLTSFCDAMWNNIFY